jgi:hypothetical protein
MRRFVPSLSEFFVEPIGPWAKPIHPGCGIDLGQDLAFVPADRFGEVEPLVQRAQGEPRPAKRLSAPLWMQRRTICFTKDGRLHGWTQARSRLCRKLSGVILFQRLNAR